MAHAHVGQHDLSEIKARSPEATSQRARAITKPICGGAWMLERGGHRTNLRLKAYGPQATALAVAEQKALQRRSSDADETGANGPERECGDDDPQHDALQHGAHADFAQSGLRDASADEEERDGEAAAAELRECIE